MTTSNTAKGEIKDEIKISIGEIEQLVLGTIRGKTKITISEIATALSISFSSAGTAVRRLREKKAIQRYGSRKSGYWEILK